LIRARCRRTHLRNADSEAKVLEVKRAYPDEWRGDGAVVGVGEIASRAPRQAG